MKTRYSQNMTTPLATTSASVGWGLFLTSSWTWCIGMWLPLVLMVQFGWPGFWLFAIPNVLGCAGMGYLIRSRRQSETLVARHRGPMRWFSVATIAYQLFFLAFIFGGRGWFPTVLDGTLPGLVVPLVAFAIAVAASWLPWKAWPWFGSLIFLATMGTWIATGNGFSQSIGSSGTEPDLELWPLAPIIILGFLACPWLDPTFHRARQLAPSRQAFGVFGICFFAVLLFVTTYFQFDSFDTWTLVLPFLFYQATFTMSAHLREIRLLEAPDGWGRTTLLSAISLVGVAIGYLLWLTCCFDIARDWLDDTYLRFLGLYGLVFPAWILAFMLGNARQTTGMIALLVIGLVIALPMAEVGMIHDTRWWLLPPVIVVIATATIISVIGGYGRTSP